MRKSTVTRNEALKAVDKVRECDQLREQAFNELKELEVIAKQAEADEIALLGSVSDQIKKICEQNKVFCGIILNTKDLTNIIDLMISKQEQVKIDFNLYYTDKE